MISYISILYKTEETFESLYQQFSEKLNTRCNLIFIIFGALSAYQVAISEFPYVKEFLGNNILIFALSLTIIGISIHILMGRYIVTYLIYWIGKWLNSKGEVIDTRVAVAYSTIPLFFSFPKTMLFTALNTPELATMSYRINYSLDVLIWILSLKILVQGLAKYNQYGYLYAVINISPLILIGSIPTIISLSI